MVHGAGLACQSISITFSTRYTALVTDLLRQPTTPADFQRVTITDVARTAGVSVATVSKVINGRYGVAAKTSERVQQVIADLGYESSLVARSLRSHRTNVIGILVAEFEPFSTEILKGTSQAITGSGYELLAYSGGGRAGEDAGWERRYLSRLSGTLIDGAILVTPTIVEMNGSVPVVAIDPHTGPSHMPTVDADNLTGAVLATEHLLALGHRRIGFLGGREDLESSRLREEGYRAALQAAGVEVDPLLVRNGGYRRQTAIAPARELLTLPDRPTAIFAANDLSALGTLDVARELGLSVPDDLSVVGFDNVPESALTEPPLTTVSQPMQEMGSQAVDLLIRLMSHTEVGSTHVRLPTGLVVRGTTRAQ
jgi:LacI family transcriptional regulator